MIQVRGFLAVCFFWFFATTVLAGPALDTVKGEVEAVLKILNDPAYKGDKGKAAKQDRIRSVSQKMFDFTELSKRTLGGNWNRFSASERQEFVSLFRGILEGAYIDKITSYSDEKISYTKEVQLSENTAEVQSVILTKGAEIPVNYRMFSRDGQWRVYDVVIEGVSLVNNYRSQFREILASNQPAYLLDTMKRKARKQ